MTAPSKSGMPAVVPASRRTTLVEVSMGFALIPPASVLSIAGAPSSHGMDRQFQVPSRLQLLLKMLNIAATGLVPMAHGSCGVIGTCFGFRRNFGQDLLPSLHRP